MKLKTTLLGKTYTFRDLKEVLAKANEEKTGDKLAGLAAKTAQERVAAKVVLSAVTLGDLRENPAVPYEEDEVTRIIQDDVNEKIYREIQNWTVSELREWLLAVVTVTLLLPVTPVKNQGRSDLCWVYAALAAIESTHAAAGDSVNLSPDYLARNMLMRQARLNWLSRGRHDMSMRGTLPMALHLLREDGAMPYDSYSTPSPINWRATSRRAVLAANCEPTFDRAERAVATGADNAAQSVCRSDAWHMFTSFTHHPFGRDIQLELADNQFGDTFHNVPLDTLIHLLDRSLDNARAVGWEGDISEEGFRWAAGVADVPRTVACTQQERQRQFDRRLTTDDHCLTIVGRAVSRRGTRYYIAKNSWGATNALRGFILLSERYVRMKTVALMVGAE